MEFGGMEHTFPGGAGRTSTLNMFTLARLDASASVGFGGLRLTLPPFLRQALHTADCTAGERRHVDSAALVVPPLAAPAAWGSRLGSTSSGEQSCSDPSCSRGVDSEKRERGALCFNNPGLRRRFAARGVRARACDAVSEEGREASEEGSCRQGRCALRVHSNQGGHVVCPRGPELPGDYSRG